MLHAHLPFVRHPEHEKFLEENWLFEAITETYIPLIQMMEGWQDDGMAARLTLSLSPPLCAMLLDPLLQDRYVRHLDGLIALAENEIHRTHWDAPFANWPGCITTASPASARPGLITGAIWSAPSASSRTRACWKSPPAPPPTRCCRCCWTIRLRCARRFWSRATHHRECFGRDPRGIWLPECAYAEGIEDVLQEANIRWFVTDTHGILHARPRPRYGVYAPGLHAQRRGGFRARLRIRPPGLEQGSKVIPAMSAIAIFTATSGSTSISITSRLIVPRPDMRGFTGIKYHRITGGDGEKQVYDRAAALRAADEHAAHFLQARIDQISKLGTILDRPPLVLSPYDAELFGHWWYEGPEFLNYFVRKACYDQQAFTLITPGEYLRRYPTQQVATPAASSWGEEGYWRVWLNETNQWIYPHLRIAQPRMTELADRFPKPTACRSAPCNKPPANCSWPNPATGRSSSAPAPAPITPAKRVKDHLHRFLTLYEQLTPKKSTNPGSVKSNKWTTFFRS